MTFRILWGVDAAVALVIAYFFVAGLADGSVSSFNMGLWLTILFGAGAILLGGPLLRAAGHPRLASLVLAVLAVPGLLYGFFLAVVILTGTPWN
jgi:hypothetical protein